MATSFLQSTWSGRLRVLVLDTNALLWLVAGNLSLGPVAKAEIESGLAEAEICVSAISFWEAAMASDRGRVTIHADVVPWRNMILRLGINELPITGEIAITAARLPDFHGDPADRLITATAHANSATLVTADRRILQWRSLLRRIDARR